MPQPFDVTNFLKAVPTDDSTRAKAWEVYNKSSNADEFTKSMSTLNLPNESKAAMWEAKFGSGAAPQVAQAKPLPPVQNAPPPSAPPAEEGALSKLWGWANQPLNIGGLREGVQHLRDYSNSGPTLAETNPSNSANPEVNVMGVPVSLKGAVGLGKRAVAGMAADAANMFVSPVGVGMLALGPTGEVAGALSKTAKTAETAAKLAAAAKVARGVQLGADVGFAGQSVADVAQHGIHQQSGETDDAYSRRMMGDVGGVLLPAIGHATGALARKALNSQTTPPATTADPRVVQAAQDRINQAIGKPSLDVAQTVHISPELAQEVHNWNQTDLPKKRIILHTYKDGTTSLKMAHVDPDKPGFQFTTPVASAKVSDVEGPDTVPLELSQTAGRRKTTTPGHFLSNQIAGETSESAMPIAGPQTGAQATAPTSTAQPIATTPATPPAASQPLPTAGDARSRLPQTNQPDKSGYSIQNKQVVPPSPGVQAVDLPTLTPEAKVGSNAEPVTQESPATIDAQMESLKKGTIKTVMLPKGSSYTPEVPKGMASLEVGGNAPGAGTYIYDPKQIKPAQIRKAAIAGTHGELLGHIQSKADVAKAPEQVAVVAQKPDGTEVQASAVDATKPAIVQQQAEVLAQRHPDAQIVLKPTEHVIADRMEANRQALAKPLSPEDTPLTPDPIPTPAIKAGGVEPGPLPPDLAKSSPNYGYKDKNFKLQFDDPHDLAAYTLGQTKDNKAQARFLDYLQKEYPAGTPDDFKDHALAVRSAIKDLAKDGDPAQGPLKIPSQGGIATSGEAPKVAEEVPQEKPAQAPTPPAETKTAEEKAAPFQPKPTKKINLADTEDRMRSMVGKLYLLKKLRVGEAVSASIDKAIEASRSVDTTLDPKTQERMSRLLKEPVGRALTEEQIDRLEKMRGGTKGSGPKLQFLTEAQANVRRSSDPDGFEKELNASMVSMVQALENPDIDPKMAKRIEQALTKTDSNGNPLPVIWHDDPTSYPEPPDTPESHPLAPFTPKLLGHDITPLNTKNGQAIFGSSWKDLFRFDENRKDAYVDPEDRIALLKAQGAFGPKSIQDYGLQPYLDQHPEARENVTSEERQSLSGLAGSPDSRGVFDISDMLGSASEDGEQEGYGSTFGTDKTRNKELLDLKREVQQKALTKRTAKMEQDLRSKIGEWNQVLGQARTPLTDQLSRLPEDVRKFLPEELFNFEKSRPSETPGTSEATSNSQSAQAASSSTKKSTPFKPGSKTGTEGIRYTKFEGQLFQSHPEALEHLPLIQKAIADRYPEPARQAFYAKTMQTYHDGVVAGQVDALRTALDYAANKGEAGFLEFGKSKTPARLGTEEERQANLDSADAILKRWEDMNPSALLSKGEGLWKRDLEARIEGAYPVSSDPVERADQMEAYNELLERHKALKAQVKPPNVTSSLLDWTKRAWDNSFASNQPQEGIIRGALGKTRRDAAILHSAFDHVDKLFESLPVHLNDQLFDSMQRHDNYDLDLGAMIPKEFVDAHEAKYGSVGDLSDLAGRLRDAMDQARNDYANVSGNLNDFIENYMAGSYTNVGKATAVARRFGARSEVREGDTKFLEKKIYDFQQEALKEGLSPVTNNPVRRALLTIEQLKRATVPHTLLDQYLSQGYATKIAEDEHPPVGWVPLANKPGYFAPSNVARTYNSFVSTGLKGAWVLPYTDFSLFDAVRHSNNLQNMAQLSFSLFHASDIVANSAISNLETSARRVLNEGLLGGRNGLTPQQRFQGLVGGIKQAFATPIAPIQDWARGRKIELNFHDPSKEMQYLRITSDLEAANANVRPSMDFHLQQVDAFKKAWAKASDSDRAMSTRVKATMGAIVHAIAAVPEISNYPLMKSIIPAMKLGATDRLLEQVHREYANATPDVLSAQVQKAVDSIDNRFGEMNYDNTFWARSTKDSLFLMARAFGWAYGTVRELGGGVRDLATTGAQVVKGGPVHVSGRTAYLGAMVATTMVLNAAYQYLRTGQPAEGIDYLYPWDGSHDASGEKNRVYPKFLYTYEAINWAHDPVGTAQHKLTPGFGTLTDIYKNEDYYHHQITDPGVGMPKNFESMFAYIAKGYQPFSVGNAQEANMRGQTSSLPSFFGIMPAPRWVGRSAAENLAYKYYVPTQNTAPKDEAQYEKQAAFLDLRNRIAQGTVTDDQVQEAMDAGKINPSMIKYLYKSNVDPDTGLPIKSNLQRWIAPLRSEDQVWNVWTKATDAEKNDILPAVIAKMAKLSSGPKQMEYMEALQEFADKQ